MAAAACLVDKGVVIYREQDQAPALRLSMRMLMFTQWFMIIVLCSSTRTATCSAVRRHSQVLPHLQRGELLHSVCGA